MKPIDKIRYLIAIGSLFVMFFNLFDCIMGGVPLQKYLLSVGLFLGVFLLLILKEGKVPIILVLYTIATLTVLDDTMDYNISYGIMMYIFSIYLCNDKIYRLFVYFTNGVILTCIAIFHQIPINDFINYIIGYIIMYTLSDLIYKEIQIRDKKES